MDVLGVAHSWSYWDRDVPDYFARTVVLPSRLSASLALVIQGVRRCGKSTLMRQLMGHYGLRPQHCVFLNFEDPRLSSSLDHEVLSALVREFRQKHSRVKKLYFFLDEIQWVNGWQRWLRSELERRGENYFFVTGSNAQLLGGELGSSLTGRHLTLELFPFSYAEADRAVDGLGVSEYLHRGGFPEPLLLGEDGDLLLRQYFNDIVERDIRERLAARSSLPIRQVAQMVFESAGSELSLRRVAGASGIAIETARSYLEACMDAYLIFECPFFAFSERKRASMNKKYYPVDPGLRRSVVTKTGKDLGKALELSTFLALRRSSSEIYYWRGRSEVDFVVRRGDRIVPYQVTLDGPQPRHDKALQEFYETFPMAEECVFVTEESFGELG